jgi:hypothetical protein
MQRINPKWAVPAALLALGATALFSDDHDKKTDVTISQPVQIPGGTVLAPGSYMFILNNSASNRSIIEIKSEDGKQLYAMLLAQRANRVERTGKTVLTFYEMPQGQPVALRQWFWPGDYDGQEFLYRHNEAAKIGQASNQTVPEATDQEYAATGNPGNSTDASQSASAAPAAVNATADQGSSTQAAAAQSASTQVSESSSTQQIATQQSGAQDNAALNDSSQQATLAPPTQPDAQADGVLLAQNTPPAAPTPAPIVSPDTSSNSPNQDATTLPQTASRFPLIGMFGLLLLSAGAALRFARQGA